MKGSKGYLEIEGQIQVCKSIPRNYSQHLKFKANWHMEVKVKISEHSEYRFNENLKLVHKNPREYVALT